MGTKVLMMMKMYKSLRLGRVLVIVGFGGGGLCLDTDDHISKVIKITTIKFVRLDIF